MSQTTKIKNFHQKLLFIQQKIEEEGKKFDPRKYLDILKSKNKFGTTIAHFIVWRGFWFNPNKYSDILKWKDDRGYTIAHAMAEQGFQFDPEKHKDILELKDSYGETVLYTMMKKKYTMCGIFWGYIKLQNL